MNIVMKDCFSKGKPLYMATSDALLYRLHGDWPALGVTIQYIPGKYNPCQISYSFAFHSFEDYRTEYPPAAPRCDFTWHWCPFLSFPLELSVFVICVLDSYILLTHIIHK